MKLSVSTVLFIIAGLQESWCSDPLTVLISGYNRKLNVFNITGQFRDQI